MALKIIKLMEFDQSNYKQDVWLKCLTTKYVLIILLLGKALKKVSLIDSKENGKNSRTGTHPYC